MDNLPTGNHTYFCKRARLSGGPKRGAACRRWTPTAAAPATDPSSIEPAPAPPRGRSTGRQARYWKAVGARVRQVV
eukprot:9634591-Alexandrium_andersonii.AAC.1